MGKVTRKMRAIAIMLSLCMILQNSYNVLATVDGTTVEQENGVQAESENESSQDAVNNDDTNPSDVQSEQGASVTPENPTVEDDGEDGQQPEDDPAEPSEDQSLTDDGQDTSTPDLIQDPDNREENPGDQQETALENTPAASPSEQEKDEVEAVEQPAQGIVQDSEEDSLAQNDQGTESTAGGKTSNRMKSSRMRGMIETEIPASEYPDAVESHDPIDLSNYITLARITDFNNNPETLSEVNYDDSFRIEINYQVGINQLLVSETAEDGLVEKRWYGKLIYTLPDEIKRPTSIIGGTVKNGNSEVGTYTIDTDGKVSIILNKGQLSTGSVIDGTLSFEGYLKQQENEQPDSVKIDWNGTLSTEIGVNYPKDLSITKSCQKEVTEDGKTNTVPDAVYDPTTGRVTYNYTIVISSTTGTDEAISLEDVVSKISGNDFTRTNPSVTIRSASGDTSVSGLSWDVSNSQDASLTLPKLDEGQSYVITYSTSEYIGTSKINVKASEKNTATASTHTDYGQDLVELAEAAPSIDITTSDYTDISIGKEYISATADPTNNTVTWKYRVKVSSVHGTDNQTITFTDVLGDACVGTGRTVQNLIVKDSKGNAVTKKDDNDNEVPVVTVSSFEAKNSNQQILSGTLPALEAGGSYIIEYEVVDSGILDSYSGTVYGHNTATVVTGDYPDGKKAETWPNVDYIGTKSAPGIKKDGALNDEESKITWTITINENKKASLDGYKLSDEFFVNAVQSEDSAFVCSVTVYSGVGNDSKSYTSVTLPVTFKMVDEKPVMEDAKSSKYDLFSLKDKLVFQYTTDVDTTAQYVSYRNQGKLEGTNGDKSAEKTVDVGEKPSGPFNKNVSTTGEVDSDENIIFNWTSTLQVPEGGIPSGSTYEDSLGNYNDNGVIVHYLTKTQLQALEISGVDSSAYSFIYVGVASDENVKNIDWKFSNDGINIDELPSSSRIVGFKIIFTQDLDIAGSDIEIQYSSTGYVGNRNNIGDKWTFNNLAKFAISNGEVYSDQASYPYVKLGESGKLVSKSLYTDTGDSLNAQAYTYDPNGNMLYYRIVINGTGTAGGEIVYTDTLPENTTLVTDSWTHGGKTYQDGKSSFHGVMIRYQELGTTTEKTYGVDDKEATEEGVTVTQENGVLKVTIPESAYKKDTTIDEVILYYALRVNLPENTITSENPTITLTNIGSATCTEDSGTDGATATIQTPNLTKEAGTYQDQTIKYTLTIEEKSEIDPSNDTGEFTVKDTLTYPSTPEKAGDNYITGVSVVPGSAKLYYYDESGEQIYLDSDKISFPDNQTSGSCTIYGYVPYTGMTYYMEYTYLFEFANTKNLEGTLTNEAYVEGQESDVWEDSTNTAFVQEFSSSTARTDNTKLQLVKVEKGNYAKVLEGAVYRLEMWDGSKWTYINRFTTDSNGVVELGEQNGQGEYFIRYNYLYRLEELTAPENHKAAEGYSYIYVDGGKSNNTPNLPENFDSLDILSITNDTYVYVEDEKTAVGEIKVEKRWEDEEGETLPDSEKRPITVKLWQSTSKETNTADTENGTPYAEQVLNDANGWEYTFEELPLKVNDQNVYYFVTEVMSENTQSAGNASSTSYVYETEIDATEGITNGTIMIKNVKTQITPIPSPEQTPTNSPTPTPVATPTNSPTPTPTSSPTPTDTPIPTPTDTPVPTPTDTPVPTPTDTPVPTPTDTPVPTPTDTPIPTPTDTPVPTPTDTPVPTPTDTPVPTPTDTPVPTPTDTPVPTPTDTPVPTPTDTPVATPTDTPVPTPTDTPVPTPTETPVATPTDTPVPTPTDTPVPTPTETPAPTPTDTPEKITISGKKTWNGLSIKQPQSITIRLYADGEEIATATASDTNDYTYSFADLDKYNEGLEIDYEIQEDPVPGYVTTYDGYDVENTLTTVKISKVDVTGGEELEGAHIQILDKEGSLVEEWDSTTQPHEIHGLLTGEEYTLRETVAPEGYTITTDTTFTLKEDGTIDEDKSSTHVSEEGTLLVEDDKTRVSIVKQNEEGTQIEGARLEIVDPDSNKVVTTWITDGKAHDVTGLLLAGKTYNLREVSAPSGYLLSEDVEFIVPEKGTDNPIVVQMTDRNASEGLGSISVTKQIVTFDTDLMEFLDITANDSTFYVGLFTDAEGRHPYGTPKAIRIQNASSGSATFTDLPDGTYYVFETDAEGNPIPYDDLEDGYEFYCTLVDEETNVVEINTKSKELEGKVNLTNVYSDWPDGYSLRGDLAVSKVVLSEETTIEVDDIFYVGVFSDQELETADVAVAQLSNNGTIHIEVPITGDGKTTQVFWIFETDAEGHRISGTEGFAYEVSGEDMVSLDTLENGLNQEITLTNTLITEEAAPTPTPTTAPTPTPTTAPTATPTAVPTATPAPKTDVPKTGDSSNAEWYLLLLAGAFIGMGASIYGKKRREK